MQLFKPMQFEISKTPKPQNPNPLQHPFFTNIQNHCSAFVRQLSDSLRQQQQTPTSKNHLQIALEDIGNQAKRAFVTGISRFGSSSSASFTRTPIWASRRVLQEEPVHCFDLAMSTEEIEERLAGVPVYALSNSNEEFVLVSGARTGKSLGLFCFKREDAEALLYQMNSMDPGMRRGSRVVAVALNKVVQLKVDGIAFRFIPESSQIINALKEKEKMGDSAKGFSGVPVFQSRSLILRSQNKRYRPVFFRKEDLENSLFRASRQQKALNPALRKGDIQVFVLEEIIKRMKESAASKWDDVVFIPPGFEASTDLNQQEKLTANA